VKKNKNDYFVKTLYKMDITSLTNFLKKEACNSPVLHRHSAAVIYKNQIMTSGHNRYIKKVLLEGGEFGHKTMHAELSAVLKIKSSIQKMQGSVDIIVIRINNRMELKNSRPCNNCIEKLRSIGIRRVYYSNETGNIVREDIDTMEKIHVSYGNKFWESLAGRSVPGRA
jgi:tRNA(Arg) A34 adenosine deaminase TadA